ncbi:MAG: fatty acid desaturase [Polyangiaceae bacterium]
MPVESPPLDRAASPIDEAAFCRDLEALRKRTLANLSEADGAHLRKVERWGRLCTLLGYATAWIAPNPLSAAAMSMGNLTRWTMVAHHVSHRGYDKVPGIPASRTSRGFAQGWRRLIDWLDWIEPAAWHHEHNVLHHYRLGEKTDPDVVEENLDWLRDNPVPRPLAWAALLFFMLTWKWTYYAPTTFLTLEDERARREHRPPPPRAGAWLMPAFWLRCVLPYALVKLIVIPALFLPLGPHAALWVLCNTLLAEVLTNLHAFLVVVTNHAGDDLYVFDAPMANKAEFYRRQVMGSTNFRTGGDLNDFLHGWLNYQIEHHLFPSLPMRQYQLIQPEVRAICEKHGVPYVQQSVFVRLRKTLAIALGDARQRREASLGQAQDHEVDVARGARGAAVRDGQASGGRAQQDEAIAGVRCLSGELVGAVPEFASPE